MHKDTWNLTQPNIHIKVNVIDEGTACIDRLSVIMVLIVRQRGISINCTVSVLKTWKYISRFPRKNEGIAEPHYEG